jgi:hypothetical protein
MILTVGLLRDLLHGLDDSMLLADLQVGNDKFRTFSGVKRILILQDESGQKYFTINSMGSHFTGDGEQSHLTYTGTSFT